MDIHVHFLFLTRKNLKQKNTNCDCPITAFNNDLKIMQRFYGKGKIEAK